MFLAKRVDGIILCSLSHDAVKSLREQKKNIPHVLVDTYENYKDFSSINIDNEYAVRCIVDHLVKLGHREFGFIGDRIVTPHRMQSFQFYLASHGINVDPENIRIGSERYETGGYLRMKEILSGRNIPTAVFAETDNLAIGAMSAAKKMTYRIPEDISIIGFDDIVASSFTEIPLTTMYQPKKKMGQMAARMLIDHIKGATDDKVVQVVLKPELIVRSTTGIPRD
jgi:DNA-binding LacI/PurR family transcriptional regulator